ncbi:hypothetical protein TNCV_3906051 [Trichonephila clavipes]|nr:hypothetical protein TNCV_3906051 [Trichonephila clavipes]
MAKFEERYSCKETQCSRSRENLRRHDWYVRRMSNDDCRRRNWRDAEVEHRPNDKRNSYRGNYENCPHRSRRNQAFESGNRFNRDNQRFNTNNGVYQSRNRGQKTGEEMSRAQVVTAQGAKCGNIGVVELQVEKVIPSIDEGNLDDDLTKTGLEESETRVARFV